MNMDNVDRNRRWALMAGALLLACGLGYGLAKVTNHSPLTDSPVATGAAAPPDGLQVPQSSLTMMGIALETVSVGDLSAEIQAPATVSAAANGQAVVTARATGTLVRLNKRLGDQVKAHEVLALVESREAAAMAAELSIAESKVELARSNLAREKGLYDQKVTPRQDLENAQAQLTAADAEASRAKSAAAAAGVSTDGRSLAVTSPIAGRITTATAALGAYVEPAMELFRVADPRYVFVEAAVPAGDATRISAGDEAKVTTASGAILDATVISVTPTLNERTRSATVTLSLASGQSSPAPGEYVQARITTKSNAGKAVVVPDEAVQSINGRDAVFVRTDNGFRVAPVSVAARSGGRASILSGLNAGETIATKNAFLLKAEISKGAEEEE
jgi:cobalt-zinc-cadmium efflux system membrane fusion protein